MRYFIIGYKNCGKTTMGRKLAHKLNLKFIDLDEEIEKREGKTIPVIYTEMGEEKFRVVEWEVLLDVVKLDNIVVALGGGAPCHCDNMNLLRKKGDVIYLKVDNETLVERLQSAALTRPIVLNKSREELISYVREMRTRCEHFYTSARYIVDGKNISVDELAGILTS